ncbi:hypothetical protein [Streptomyces sp. NBC_00316]|uniref:hypothetical protein n=1 Tax=Streptomyces sp. NBC_00316 TaxID=2975710 RepID=UPI002E2DDE08|nr:hypothetical protein [Streptomyces sp. NBC_00316]
MTDVLHLQSRAYPLHHSLPVLALESVTVPDHGELRPFTGELGTLAYNPDFTIELDLTGLITTKITLPGTEIVGCHARILSAGSILVAYALRHDVDLRELSLHDLDAFDARINRQLREADSSLLTAVLTAAVRSGLIKDLVLRPDLALSGEQAPVDRRSARYNCHFVTQAPPWQPDPRVPALSSGPACRVLLPYTYAWDADPGTGLLDLLTMTEPTDIAVAQQSLLVGALVGGRRILADLAAGQARSVDVHAFRRFLDGVWSDYHHLDSYRIESTQNHRSTYLAARESIGLDGTHERADKLLGYVGSSLLAASSQRAEALDTRLNRVAASLAMVTAAAFGLDAVGFLLPNVSLGIRISAVAGLITLTAAGILAVVFPRRPRRTPAVAEAGPADPPLGRPPAGGPRPGPRHRTVLPAPRPSPLTLPLSGDHPDGAPPHPSGAGSGPPGL